MIWGTALRYPALLQNATRAALAGSSVFAAMVPHDSRPFRVPRANLYPVVGTLLALGAPGGLVVLRRLLARDPTLHGALADVTSDATTYAYLTVSTAVAFVSIGMLLGRAADRLRAFATTDPLTGLSNRRHFHERVVTELERARRYGSPLSLLLVDVDRLKQINDQGGHGAGDAALRRVAAALSASCRGTDLVGRWGGDEFTVLTPGITAGEAVALGARIRKVLREADEPAFPTRTTVSVGITDLARLKDATPEALYAMADAALYEAKQAGRDRTVVHESPGGRA